VVQDVEAILVKGTDEAPRRWEERKIPLMVDSRCESRDALKPQIIVDAILAKKSLGTSIHGRIAAQPLSDN